MSEPIIYIDNSEIREGKLDELKAAIKDLVEFVEANEPQLIAYNVYFSEDGTRMTVLHVNRDPESLAFHMKVGGPQFPKLAGFIKMLTIDVYGKINDDLLEQLRQKAQMLGSGVVRAHELQAGFARFP
jgi:quinol monooxygenase YgiN